MIVQSNLPNAGVYTAVGTYDYEDLLVFLEILHNETKIPIPALIKAFGTYLFKQLATKYPDFFIAPQNTFEFLQTVHNHVHIEVKKLYKDAELPSFLHHIEGKNRFILDYTSKRKLVDLAEGMIISCIEHFKEKISIERIDNPENFGSSARFILTKN